MNDIRFNRRKTFHEKDELAYYYKHRPKTMFFTMNEQNRKLRINTIIKIIRHETLHDVLMRHVSEKASISIDNKWPHAKIKILAKRLNLETY